MTIEQEYIGDDLRLDVAHGVGGGIGVGLLDREATSEWPSD